MTKQETIELIVEDVCVVFTEKRIKNINIHVKRPDGQVIVSAPYWVSRSSVISFITKKLPWIRERQKVMAQSLGAGVSGAGSEQIAGWKNRVETETKQLIAKWEPIIGVKSHTTVFRNMTSRWGSCNPKTGRICINIQLANYPAFCLEYVVVHELCHLIERGHGPRFKALLDQFLPDWKTRRALLK